MHWKLTIKKIFIFLCLGMSLLSTVAAYALTQDDFNMPRGVTPISHDIYTLHMTIFWICVAIGILVFGVMFYSLFYHRKSRGVIAAQFHEHAWVEFLWVVIPFIILVVMAIPASLVLMRMEDQTHSDISIRITGYQWKWKYDYLDNGISFFSVLSTPLEEILGKKPKSQWYLLEVDKNLVVPINKKIRFLVTANDVIHSWWVPAFGIKRDAIPGFIHESWARIEKPGIYRGQCAELCGVGHGFMPIVVEAKTQEDYDKWVALQRQQLATEKAAATVTLSYADLMKQGQATYNKTCAACHKDNGAGIPPVFPALKGSSVTVGNIVKHIQIVLKGVPNTAMQAFDNQLNDAELAAVITYERNAWGNNTGDAVQPSDIKAIRAGAKILPSKEKAAEPAATNKMRISG
ncbi:cytochrome c oxidase subunit II [soil metagenome]